MSDVETAKWSFRMTSCLVLYTTRWAKLLQQSGTSKRTFRLFRFGLLPHEIAALNAR